jgi:hypothetical protein
MTIVPKLQSQLKNPPTNKSIMDPSTLQYNGSGT